MSRLTPPVNDNDHIRGLPSAGITLVEFGDFQCSSCASAYPEIKEVQRVLGKELRFVYRHFPMSNIHAYAFSAAVAAEAAGKQNKFWQMHDMIFERQVLLSEYALLEFAEDLGLNMRTFRNDLADESLPAKVEYDFESGVMSGVNGTPSFYINGFKYNGSPDYPSLLNAIVGQSSRIKDSEFVEDLF